MADYKDATWPNVQQRSFKLDSETFNTTVSTLSMPTGLAGTVTSESMTMYIPSSAQLVNTRSDHSTEHSVSPSTHHQYSWGASRLTHLGCGRTHSSGSGLTPFRSLSARALSTIICNSMSGHPSQGTLPRSNGDLRPPRGRGRLIGHVGK